MKDGLVLTATRQFAFLIRRHITFLDVCMAIVMDQICVLVRKDGKVNSAIWVYVKIV